MSRACPVCETPELTPFLRRSDVPVHQNLLMRDRLAARSIPRGDLALEHCPRCGFVTNSAFAPGLLAYGQEYENTQTASPAFARHVDALVEALVAEGVAGKRVVEVGCGKGLFLERLCVRGGNVGTGFDPSYVGPDTAADGRARFVRTFYGREHAATRAEIVVCRHVIEHVPDPVRLLREVRAAVRGAPEAVVYFETPALEWILEGTVLWDFFYEHCSYFTEASLRNAFRRAGFEPLALHRVFGGQYLWIKARPSEVGQGLEPAAASEREALERYRRQEAREMERWEAKLERLSSAGRLAVWGAGAKGVTFVNLMDRAASRVLCLIDINPAKDGHYAPGTGHPIVSPEAARSFSLSDAILMNPNYLDETRGMLESVQLALRLHAAA